MAKLYTVQLIAAVAVFSLCRGVPVFEDGFFFNDQPTVVDPLTSPTNNLSLSEDNTKRFKRSIHSPHIDSSEGSGEGSGEGNGGGSGEGSGENVPNESDMDSEWYTLITDGAVPEYQENELTTVVTTQQTISISSLSTSRTLDLIAEELTTEVAEIDTSTQNNQIVTEVTVNLLSTTTEEEETLINNSTVTVPSRPSLVSVEVCGKQYYCLAGSRGPCAANEILSPSTIGYSIEHNVAPCCSAALSTYPWKGCYSSIGRPLATATSSGGCALKSIENPCSGLPSNYRYDSVKKMCRPYDNLTRNWLKEYCGQDQVFIGVRRDSCRCRHPKHIQYVGDNRCYQPYTRGPCPSGQWLVPSSRKEMDCQVCPCPDLADGHHFYWKGHFYGPAGCYRSQTRGPCEEGSTFVMNSLVSNEPHCFIN